jgi:hypothetical protein
MNPFQSLPDYEEYIYTLKRLFPSIERSSLVVVRRGKQIAILQGELTFPDGYRLTIKERLSCDADTVRIESYGYEIWHYAEKAAWYDDQPHPHDLALAGTQPHHKHVPPDVKHNRIPAPQMNFTVPNLPALIAKIESLIRL